jgi:hypothetical protein
MGLGLIAADCPIISGLMTLIGGLSIVTRQ